MNYKVLKIAILGESYVGKSDLCSVIANREPEKEYNCTIGVDFFTKYIEYTPLDKYKITIWDLSGARRFQSIVLSYIRLNNFLIFCYSAEDKNTFLEIERRYILYKHNGYLANKTIFIVACKIDSQKIDPEYEEWGKYLSSTIGCGFYKTSSKTKIGIELLHSVIDSIPKNIKKPDYINLETGKEKNRCCNCVLL